MQFIVKTRTDYPYVEGEENLRCIVSVNDFDLPAIVIKPNNCINVVNVIPGVIQNALNFAFNETQLDQESAYERGFKAALEFTKKTQS